MRGCVASSILRHRGSSSAAATRPMLRTATKTSTNIASIQSNNQCTMRALMSTATKTNAKKMLRQMGSKALGSEICSMRIITTVSEACLPRTFLIDAEEDDDGG
mmetsp:Transcript_27775/g.41321  ORF Transcript_27775/g.41321 Transcript_27775/m.41321 type:complete len:104 (-) Transcript_27775:229-540(-)